MRNQIRNTTITENETKTIIMFYISFQAMPNIKYLSSNDKNKTNNLV